jgi:hypothetical protein
MTRAETVHAGNGASGGWSGAWRRDGFFFRQAAILTLLMGGYVHVTRGFIGDELLLRHVLTQTYDQLLAIPMTYAVVTGVLGWWLIDFRGPWHRFAYVVVILYFIASLPLHVRSFFDESSVEALTMFPMWWTYVLYVVFPVVIVFCWRLRYKTGPRRSR